MLAITMKNPFQKSTFKHGLKNRTFTKSNKTFTIPNRPHQRPHPLPRIEQKPADMQQSNNSNMKLTFFYLERSETYWYHEPTGAEVKQMKTYEQHYLAQNPLHTDHTSQASTRKKGEIAMAENSQCLSDFQETHTLINRNKQGINMEYLFGADLDISTCHEQDIEIEEELAKHHCTFHHTTHQGQADWLDIIDEAEDFQTVLRDSNDPLSFLNSKLVLLISSIIDFLTTKRCDLLSSTERGQLWALLRVMGANLSNFCILLMANLMERYEEAPEGLRLHYQLQHTLVKERLLGMQLMSTGNLLREDTDILLIEIKSRM